MASPAVAIGMPVYNGEPYLAKSISSILNQDYTEFRLIVSDNASTDNSPDIIREFARDDDRIQYHISSENKGGAWNFNRVFHLSDGRYFKWAASDDTCAETMLSSCLRAFDENGSEPVLAYPRTMLIDGSGNRIREDTRDWHLRLDQPNGPKRAAEFIRWHSLCNSLFGLIRRDALARTRLIQPLTGGDLVLHCELLLQGPYAKIDQVLFNRRIHSGQAMIANSTAVEKRRWFDQQFDGTKDSPYQRLVREYLTAVSLFHPTGYRRARASATVGRAAVRRHGRGLLGEIMGLRT